MPTLYRILKYTPAVVLGLLVVAWVVSWFGTVSVSHTRRSGSDSWYLQVACRDGTVFFPMWPILPPEKPPNRWNWRRRAKPAAPKQTKPTKEVVLGQNFSLWMTQPGPYGAGAIAIPLLLTALLPLAIGPFISFRFRLWHYLAYTALVAVELAYYLRWQG
jgi:hypothetical protein